MALTNSNNLFIDYKFVILGENDSLSMEEKLLKTIRSGEFQKIKKEITPRALGECTNSLLTGMKVCGELFSDV